MNYKKLLLIFSLALLATACGNVVGLNTTGGTGGLDPKQLEKAADQFCTSYQKLDEISDGTNVPFGQLNYQSRLFAFASADSSKKCIIDHAVNESWPENGTWFSLNPNDNCLPNGSVWEAIQSTASGNGQYYSLVMVGDPNRRIMNMNGHQGIRGTYLRDNLGLKILRCVSK